MNEIGSEFSNGVSEPGINRYCQLIDAEKRCVLSGRTALSCIASDMREKHNIRCVALPSYCCASMVYPFYNKEIDVVFYDNIISTHTEEVFSRADAVLVMDYFGFSRTVTYELAGLSKSLNKVLIVDATQTAFSRLPHYELANYIIVSHRKWTDSLSASMYCRDGFSIPGCTASCNEYADLWRCAAKEKAEYLSSGSGDKQHFLDLYGKANHMLVKNYENMSARSEEAEHFENLDSDRLRRRRRANAEVLLNGLAQINDRRFSLPFTELKKEDCPLFVPVLVERNIRQKLREILREQSIYCPMHWPVDLNYPHCTTVFHETELSLICDQRYGPADMQRELDTFAAALNQISSQVFQ